MSFDPAGQGAPTWAGCNLGWIRLTPARCFLSPYGPIVSPIRSIKLQLDDQKAFNGKLLLLRQVSENATEAVVWEIDASDTLYAWNAANLAPLWNSNAPADRADCKNWVKFATPTIAGGKVFMGCGSKLVAYGPK